MTDEDKFMFVKERKCRVRNAAKPSRAKEKKKKPIIGRMRVDVSKKKEKERKQQKMM